MPDRGWIIINALLGIPVAALLVCLGREAARFALAHRLDFRIFALRLGVGRPWIQRPIGALDLAWAPIPLGGATIAHTARAPRHRNARIALAVAPAVAQLLWIGLRLLAVGQPDTAPLTQGFAPLTCLDLANAFLLVLHTTLPLELPGGVRTDVRRLLDALLGPADAERTARAHYYARLARHRLERSDVGGARRAIQRGLRQLGPEPLLVEVDRHLRRSTHDSVVDQVACAETLRAVIEQAEPRRNDERTSWSRRERLRQGAFSLLPGLLAVIGLVVVQREYLVRSFERGLLDLSERLVERDRAKNCAAMSSGWAQWSARFDPWFAPSPESRRDRSLALAELALCRGDEEAADRHETNALLAANGALKQLEARRFVEPDAWLQAELQVTRLLRRAAEREMHRSAHRNALRSLARAEQRLTDLHAQLGLISPEARNAASNAIGGELSGVEAARARVIERLAAH